MKMRMLPFLQVNMLFKDLQVDAQVFNLDELGEA